MFFKEWSNCRSFVGNCLILRENSNTPLSSVSSVCISSSYECLCACCVYSPFLYLNVVLLNCSLHCEHCLSRNSVEKAGNWISRKVSLSYSTSSKAIVQRCHIHSLLFLRQRNVRTFTKTPHGIFPGVTRILINKNMYSERMFTTHIVRAVMRVARVRYFLLGAAGAGGVAAKVVSFILTCSVM